MFTFSANGKQPISMTADGEIGPWWHPNECGFILLQYQVPDDLPKSAIDCEFQILEIDRRVEEEFGELQIYIRKGDEK